MSGNNWIGLHPPAGPIPGSPTVELASANSRKDDPSDREEPALANGSNSAQREPRQGMLSKEYRGGILIHGWGIFGRGPRSNRGSYIFWTIAPIRASGRRGRRTVSLLKASLTLHRRKIFCLDTKSGVSRIEREYETAADKRGFRSMRIAASSVAEV